MDHLKFTDEVIQGRAADSEGDNCIDPPKGLVRSGEFVSFEKESENENLDDDVASNNVFVGKVVVIKDRCDASKTELALFGLLEENPRDQLVLL